MFFNVADCSHGDTSSIVQYIVANSVVFLLQRYFFVLPCLTFSFTSLNLWVWREGVISVDSTLTRTNTLHCTHLVNAYMPLVDALSPSFRLLLKNNKWLNKFFARNNADKVISIAHRGLFQLKLHIKTFWLNTCTLLQPSAFRVGITAINDHFS